MSTLPPSQSYLARQSQAQALAEEDVKPSPPLTYATASPAPVQSQSSTAQTVFLVLLFLTNILLIVLLALILAKVWLLESMVHGVVNSDYNGASWVKVGGTVDVGYVVQTVAVRAVS